MNLQDVQPEMKVTWIHTPRGGYGFGVPVSGVVLAKTKARVKIRVRRETDGKMVERFVRPENLRPAQGEQEGSR